MARLVACEQSGEPSLQSRDLAGGSRGLGLSTSDAPIKVVGVLEVPNHSAPVSPTGAFSWEWILSFHVQGVDCQMVQCGGRPTVRVWRLCRTAS